MKSFKIFLSILAILITIVIIDTLQAKIFNNSTMLKIREKINENSYIDKGILVNHYYCNDNKKTTTWKMEKYNCPIDQKEKLEFSNYSKVIENIIIELNIPEYWKYEELSKKDNYKFELKIYKDSKSGNATIYFLEDKFSVCGTGLTTEKLKLNSGIGATIGYYKMENPAWEFIKLDDPYSNIILINNSLNENDSNEILELIKTMTITPILSQDDLYN